MCCRLTWNGKNFWHYREIKAAWLTAHLSLLILQSPALLLLLLYSWFSKSSPSSDSQWKRMVAFRTAGKFFHTESPHWKVQSGFSGQKGMIRPKPKHAAAERREGGWAIIAAERGEAVTLYTIYQCFAVVKANCVWAAMKATESSSVRIKWPEILFAAIHRFQSAFRPVLLNSVLLLYDDRYLLNTQHPCTISLRDPIVCSQWEPIRQQLVVAKKQLQAWATKDAL